MSINVLHVTAISDIGGAERIVLKLAEHSPPPYRYVITSLSGKGELGKYAAHLNIPYYDLDIKKIWAFPKMFHRILKQHNIKIIQTHGLTAECAVIFAAGFKYAPLIPTLHGVHDYSDGIKKYVIQMARPFADHWISVTQKGKQILTDIHIPPSRIQVIPNGLPVKDIPATVKQNNRCFNVLTVANLRPVKGHIYLLKAINTIIRSGHRNIHFTLVGRDDMHSRLQQYAKDLKISDYITFTGFKKNINYFLGKADLFVLPSLSEGLPLSIIEAMYCRLPVIATNVGGIPEIIIHKKTGLLVEPADSEDLYRKIMTLYPNAELRQKLVTNAYDYAVKNFSITTMIKSYVQFYNQVLKHAC
ncbi:MAG: glycosyltransferase family 4 protein [candidate division KSB1 bacterium]|nr:glycosyltransferase family 4 protein [candidate division KSB1 bacterium]